MSVSIERSPFAMTLTSPSPHHENHDSYGFRAATKGLLMAVADGVSSDPNAKQASLAAVKSVMAYTGSNPAEMFWRAHKKVMALKGPSTTLVTAHG